MQERRAACALCVVPFATSGHVDRATEVVAGVFARRGFTIVLHRGLASLADVVGEVERSGAMSVLLSPNGREDTIRFGSP
jgi:hypothetical protein